MITVDIPGALVEGEIYTLEDDRLLLEEGMLHVAVGPFSIDVSWRPEHDPDGKYVITAYGSSWEEQLNTAETSDPYEADEIARRMAQWLLSKGGAFVPSSSTSDEYTLVV